MTSDGTLIFPRIEAGLKDNKTRASVLLGTRITAPVCLAMWPYILKTFTYTAINLQRKFPKAICIQKKGIRNFSFFFCYNGNNAHIWRKLLGSRSLWLLCLDTIIFHILKPKLRFVHDKWQKRKHSISFQNSSTALFFCNIVLIDTHTYTHTCTWTHAHPQGGRGRERKNIW